MCKSSFLQKQNQHCFSNKYLPISADQYNKNRTYAHVAFIAVKTPRYFTKFGPKSLFFTEYKSMFRIYYFIVKFMYAFIYCDNYVMFYILSMSIKQMFCSVLHPPFYVTTILTSARESITFLHAKNKGTGESEHTHSLVSVLDMRILKSKIDNLWHAVSTCRIIFCSWASRLGVFFVGSLCDDT